MDLLADLSRRLESLIRLGTIAEVDYELARCRVRSGELLTAGLPWLTLRAGETRTWCPPTVGEQVLLLCPSGEPAAGIVLTGLYSAAKEAPSEAPSAHVTSYPDGATISYDHASGALTATGIKSAVVVASESTHITCPTNTIEGDLIVTGKATVQGLFTYLAGMSGAGGAGGGRTQITGDFTHEDGALSSNGTVLDDHAHDNVVRGNEVSGKPV
ncbi:MAG: phage baseplate assembly protein V [Moraxellaceae bacterium]|nr:phage baseplate assembly protein V [Moraxellaceae bacterium]